MIHNNVINPRGLGGAQWLGQCARRAIAEAKQRSQKSIIGWVIKIYYRELLRASEGTLSRWSRLHLHSLALKKPDWARVGGYGPFSLCVIHKEVFFQGGLTSGRRSVVKINAESLSQHDEKHVLPTPLSLGKLEKGRKKKKIGTKKQKNYPFFRGYCKRRLKD
jgi:hypothetical protein